MDNLPISISKEIINYLGGEEYLYERKQLSYLSKAIDLYYSNYSDDSYWKWGKWREKNGIISISKPTIPERFKKIKNNPFIISVDPPLISKNIDDLMLLHEIKRKYIFNNN
jgi:hypothetical protein